MVEFDDSLLTLRHTPGNANGDATGADHVDDAIASRRSVRAYLPDPVPLDLVEHILAVASRAPSGTNMQPWKVHVVSGAARERLSREILDSLDRGEDVGRSWKYYPDTFPDVYLQRRRKVGWDMFSLAGVEKGDREAADRQRRRNYVFFDAPVGLIFTVDERLEIGSWIDYGCFIQNVMTAARGHGLHTCAQAAFASVHKPIRRVLPLDDGEVLVCGMALGYADESAPINRLETVREPVSGFATFHGD